MSLSPAALALLIAEEGLDRPDCWPGEESGMTLGLGDDAAFLTARQFKERWAPYLTAAQLAALLPGVGLRGDRARAFCRVLHARMTPPDNHTPPELQPVRISREVALAVFKKWDEQEYIAQTLATFKGSDQLPADSFGALFSVVYNRGDSLEGERRREMRQIRWAVTQRHWEQVPELIRSMRRLWPNNAGLRRRRDNEARLFSCGLSDTPHVYPAAPAGREPPAGWV